MRINKGIATALATGGMIFGGMALPGTANAAPDTAASTSADWLGSKTAAPATCYHSAQPVTVVNGRTIRGTAKVYCRGGSVRIRVEVQVQKKINGVWRNMGYKSVYTRTVGYATQTFQDTNAASVGYWRTWSRATILNNGATHVAVSAQRHIVRA